MQNSEQQQQSATGSSNERISEGISNGVQQPTDDDVLCGKSNACLHHVGSKRFRVYLETYVEAYAQATTKYEKMQLTKEIYSNLRKKSRFLKYNKKSELWEHVNENNVRDKIGHALRYIKRKAPESTTRDTAAAVPQTVTVAGDREPPTEESPYERHRAAFSRRRSWPFLEPEGADDMVAGQSHPKKLKRLPDPLSTNTSDGLSEENEQAFYSDYAVASVKRRHTSEASPKQWRPIDSKLAHDHQHQYSQEMDCTDESVSDESLCILPVIGHFDPSALAQSDNNAQSIVPPTPSDLTLPQKNPDRGLAALPKDHGIYSDMEKQKVDDLSMDGVVINRTESQKRKSLNNPNNQQVLSNLDDQKGHSSGKAAAEPASLPTVAVGIREEPTVRDERSAEEITQKIATHIFGDGSPDKDDLAGTTVMQEPLMEWDQEGLGTPNKDSTDLPPDDSA